MDTATHSVSSPVADDARWQSVLDRDAAADGRFWYSVKTTGVYCRPSCAARTPRRENVAFHASRQAARAAGFRACKRCKPDDPPLEVAHAKAIARACREIEKAETKPSLDRLAEVAGLSRFHFHRVFKAITGVTPSAYAEAHRHDRVRGELARGESVTSALYGAGFNSSGRFYANAKDRLGMTPTAFKAGGTGETIRFAIGECSLGSILVAATAKGVCAITLGDDPDVLVQDLQDRFRKAQLVGGDRAFEQLVARVVALVEAPGSGADLPLDVRGTAFQQRVWRALQRIPAGSTASYADIARRIGMPTATRAVAQACGANALAVAIPCHRVVRNDGALSGYRWGVERKRTLLAREAAA
ncbi:MAG TPA: bifunctional DNA-binding transcriptional regulator/O6-methylguanine-DNA methyltransferase Ada [Nevskiaceae bacterium]|nr:bifunctional DNA-binding transcriptional regulator/O6-methylguanine-DNA methyltransferase Ada [Nevskiaceae bacterium]